MLAIRPPIDFPPIAMRPAPASAIASFHAARRTGVRSGAGRPPDSRRARMYGNSKRRTRMPSPASAFAIDSMKGESMGAPAPWAKTNVTFGRFGPSARKEITGE